MLKLGTLVSDRATGVEGMLTHLHIEANHTRLVGFQPRSIDPETGKPSKTHWIIPERVEGGIVIRDPDLPIQVLGTPVEDTATGFKGTAISLCLFISGCVHVTVQPQGLNPKNGETWPSVDFDIRRLRGAMLPVMTNEEIEADKAAKPSPMDAPERHLPSL